ncbi:uncharacterized protein LMH87_007828 [Akanthomyces muscarius]|uniref:Uncharacterized protein n=1 Tax=Akanthomyces muscarius TaxID=2231603 RepID=A0A9W8QJ05_AKAMU|nr:uncharacterized protein LMH87_007828 [Akanthomyces muscarius]KAJ4159891.1 hypothetical protein LMH87_007828 [Akanthomyces muscarius]
MEKDTILVEKQGVSTPWQYTSEMAKHGGKIVPNSWFVDNGRCLPYEFSFVPFTKPEPPELSTYASFATEYFQLVEAAGLQDLVGLRRLFGDEGTGMLECTEGKANIMFSSDEVPADRLENGTSTLWFFDGHPPFRMYKCSCVDTSPTSNTNHNHIDRN